MADKSTVVFGLLGTEKDAGEGDARWQRNRPTVAICRQRELPIDRFELLHSSEFNALAELVAGDIRECSPRTVVRTHVVDWADPWDFEEVYGGLHDFARDYPFQTEAEDYLVHMATGTHVARICLFLLTESHHFPARLLEVAPAKTRRPGTTETYRVIDLDLSRYDRLASRFARESQRSACVLKSGIETRNRGFNELIARIEKVAISSTAPVLLMGPTGAGKSQLARRIYDLKRSRHQLQGPFVEVNCATLRGDAAMSALFGHVRGSFTGAVKDRPGLLRTADGGVLLLDEIGELGLDEQAMLLRAVEEKRFLPVGADTEVGSSFQLIAGTNRDLSAAVRSGRFREDLLARINLWTFRLPALRERLEDLEPNVQYELDKYTQATGQRVTFSKEARGRFLRFAAAPAAAWTGNFRDLNASVIRMATLSSGGRITVEAVDQEVARLKVAWSTPDVGVTEQSLLQLVSAEKFEAIDPFDRVQLAEVVRVCRGSRTLSEAGRKLFSASRQRKGKVNDADRLRKYLARFGLSWEALGER